MFSIEMFPAYIGDALWVEYGDADRPSRVLIDGGLVGTAGKLRERIEAPIAELDRLARLLNRYLSPLRHEPEPLAEVSVSDLVEELCGLLRYRLPRIFDST